MILFLDIDGVLNRHDRLPNGYCGMHAGNVACLNLILDSLPEIQVVVSSAWRYTVLNGATTLEGFEHLLLTHGVKCHGRLLGVTMADPETFDPEHHSPPFDASYWGERGLRWRKEQVLAFALDFPHRQIIVLDDLDLDMPELVKCEPTTGLTHELACMVIKRLGGVVRT